VCSVTASRPGHPYGVDVEGFVKHADLPGLPKLPRGRRDFVRQLVIWFGFVFGYQVARGLADRGAAEAFRNGRRVLRLEDALGMLFEPDLQRWALAAGHVLIDAMSLTYWLSQFVVVLFALLWIYLHRVDSYLPVRNTIIIANTIALIIYVAIPTAPPRLFPAWGFEDAVAASSLGAPTGLVALLANPYAAMPSLHAADAVIIGFALAVLVHPPWLKAVFVLWPAWVAFSLVATANHYWLDIVAGLSVAAVGAGMSLLLERRRQPDEQRSIDLAHGSAGGG
jgi:membrane-associated phospholipid phosphatase